DDVANAGVPRRREHVEAARDVVVEEGRVRGLGWTRDRREVDEAIDGLPALVDAPEQLVDLAEVGQVDAGEAGGTGLAGRRHVGVPDLVAVRQELGHGGPSELATPASYDDAHPSPPRPRYWQPSPPREVHPARERRNRVPPGDRAAQSQAAVARVVRLF